jgi:hypothetical protein
MLNHGALPGQLKNEITGAVNMLSQITNINNLKNFRAITYSKIKKDYDNTIKVFEQQELMRRLHEKEQEYIAACLDEVMIEMGYDLLGGRTVVKKTGKKFKNELYSFDNDVVLNVAYSSDGVISMEVGKADKSDRVPTSYEAEKLVEEMQEFCADFVEIENKLKTRGVLIKNWVSHMSPTIDHTHIINIDDYNINAEADIKAASRRKTKRAANSAMSANINTT